MHAGYCLDNIREGSSTIEGAGRGAFAKRRLEKGSVVAPAPLVQIIDSSVLDSDMANNNATSQLLLNYCFGHRTSKLLLCPTTHVTLINHNYKAPNAEIRWSKPSQNLLDADINYPTQGLGDLAVQFETASTFNTRLAFEIVATEDIEVGQELFLNYGPEWENAFQEHKRLWSPPTDKSHIPPSEMNEMDKRITLSKDLPPYYVYECRLEPNVLERQSVDEVGDDYDKMIKLYGETHFLRWHPCRILVTNDDGTFQAEAFSMREFQASKIRRWKNIPRDAIRFVDNKYQSDQHPKSDFRHYIPLPDTMFPFRWRSDYTTAASLHLGNRTVGTDATLPENQEHHAMHEEEVRKAKCGVYFAPSNIPHAGFGTYTAVPLVGKGVVVGTSMPVIPVFLDFEREWNGADYVWDAAKYNAEYESAGAPGELSITNVLAVNDGALANSHRGLINEDVEPSVFDPALDRCKDPGAGAFSDYVHYAFKSQFALGQGEELFVDYGETW